MDSINQTPIPPETRPNQIPLNQTPLPPKKFNWIYILIALIFIILAVLFVTPLMTPNSIEVDNESPAAKPSESQAFPTRDFTGNWKEYTNAKYKFSLKYPQEMNFSINQESTPRPLIEGISEGAIFSVQDTSISVAAGTVSDYYKAFPLAKIAEIGSLINSCYEDDPAQSEKFTNAQGDEGLKVSYWRQSGCQGATTRTMSSPHIFFYRQADTTTIVEITSVGMDERIDQVGSSFQFSK